MSERGESAYIKAERIFEEFICSFDPDIDNILFEKWKNKIKIKQNLLVKFNKIYLFEYLLPKYIYIYNGRQLTFSENKCLLACLANPCGKRQPRFICIYLFNIYRAHVIHKGNENVQISWSSHQNIRTVTRKMRNISCL